MTLQITALSHTFNPGDVNEIRALHEINLQVEADQFVTIIGSNGAGKSTLFNVIAGVYPPTRGEIEIAGENVTRWSEHRRARMIGRVFQNPLMGTAASMTIAENLTLALLRADVPKLRIGVTRSRRRAFCDLLAPLDLGLENRLDTRVALLSGGQRQALTLMMACLDRPRLLLLDEHTAALDPATAQKILTLTQEMIQTHQLTTLMITHNMQQALDFGDRTLMMDQGQIILDLGSARKAGTSVQDLIDQFAKVKHTNFLEDRLLLTGGD